MKHVIYLQTHDEGGNPTDEVTWCQDEIHDTDTAYVRMDKYRAAVKLLRWVREWGSYPCGADENDQWQQFYEDLIPAIDVVLRTAVDKVGFLEEEE